MNKPSSIWRSINSLIITLIYGFVLGTMNLLYKLMATPPTVPPIIAPSTGTGIKIYPATAEPIPTELVTPKWAMFLIFSFLSTTLLLAVTFIA